MSSKTAELNLRLHQKQTLVLESRATEILYGGAAGGGKSHLMRVLAVILCAGIPGFQAYLFRRQSTDLEKNHLEGPKGFRNLLAPWTVCGLAQIVQGEIRFWNGSKIYLCHCKDEADIYNYQGAEMHALFIDEATYFTEKMVQFLRSRLRIPGLNVPANWKHRLPLFLLSANPIGPGVEWVKRWFVDPHPPYTLAQMPNSDGGMLRQYIPALLEDNPSMTEDDPNYENKLEGMGSPALVRAMRRGDWTAIEGAFFQNFGTIIIPPFEIPRNWLRARSLDWGYAKPFSVGWWAVSNGELPPFRAGEVIRYKEWYGARAPNEGLRLDVPLVAEGIKERDNGDEIAYSVADPAIFQEDGGPCIGETFAQHGIIWRPADNKRLPGWQQYRDRIAGYDGRPMMWTFDTCRDFIRTVPFLVHDDKKPEDLDTDGEDHSADEGRYFLMSRPWVKPIPEPKRSITLQNATFQDMLSAHLAGKKRHSLR